MQRDRRIYTKTEHYNKLTHEEKRILNELYFYMKRRGMKNTTIKRHPANPAGLKVIWIRGSGPPRPGREGC